MRRLFLGCFIAFILAVTSAQAWPNETAVKLGILDFGTSSIAKLSTEKIRTVLRSVPSIQLIDADLTATAARGAGYSGSLNMSTTEARDLGAAMDAEFYLLGDAQTVRRSSSNTPVYFESYCSIFLISSRSGRLVWWTRPRAESSTAAGAEEELGKALLDKALVERLFEIIKNTQVAESNQRSVEVNSIAPLIAEAPDDDKTADAQGLRLPRPYRRLRPAYPDTAALAEAEATVDVLVDVDEHGEVKEVQIARWAGFGLDETTVATVRQLHFFPALRNGTPIPMRVLLRYNFRKPSQ